MFAIEIREDTVDKILSRFNRYSENEELRLDVYAKAKAKYYYVFGYTDGQDRYKEYSVLPAYLFEKEFEFDSEKIQTDWDQVVRLPS